MLQDYDYIDCTPYIAGTCHDHLVVADITWAAAHYKDLPISISFARMVGQAIVRG